MSAFNEESSTPLDNIMTGVGQESLGAVQQQWVERGELTQHGSVLRALDTDEENYFAREMDDYDNAWKQSGQSNGRHSNVAIDSDSGSMYASNKDFKQNLLPEGRTNLDLEEDYGSESVRPYHGNLEGQIYGDGRSPNGAAQPKPESGGQAREPLYLQHQKKGIQERFISHAGGLAHNDMSMTEKQQGHKLFVGMICRSVTEQELHNIFSWYGRLLEIHLMRNLDGVSKGCAFVKFSTYSSSSSNNNNNNNSNNSSNNSSNNNSSNNNRRAPRAQISLYTIFLVT